MAYRADLRLPKGVDLQWVSGSGYFTRSIRTESGKESRNQEWDQTLAKFVMRYNARRPRVWEQIGDMFDAAAGMAHSWPLRDPKHNVATAEQGAFDLIDATHARMVVRKSVASYTFERQAKPDEDAVFNGGTGLTYTFATGILTFATIPTSWQGPYFIAARFDTDALELTGVNRKKNGELLAGYKDVPLQEVRDE